MPTGFDGLAAHLEEARALGFLGPGPVLDQIVRSLAFETALAEACGPAIAPRGLAVDLGTGGGLPGLVLADAWPESNWLFVEANQRRSIWLERTVAEMGLAARVTVVHARAEVVGRGPYRHRASLVTARSFAPPATTAECAAPLLVPEGILAVADAPGRGPAAERWPDDGVAELDLALVVKLAIGTKAGPVSITLLRSRGLCRSIYPRRTGLPAKRPLF